MRSGNKNKLGNALKTENKLGKFKNPGFYLKI